MDRCLARGLKVAPRWSTGVPRWSTGVPRWSTGVPRGLRGYPVGLRGYPVGLRGYPVGLRGYLVGLRGYLVGHLIGSRVGVSGNVLFDFCIYLYLFVCVLFAASTDFRFSCG